MQRRFIPSDLSMVAFTLITLMPALLLAWGAFSHGFWLWVGFAYMAALGVVLDQLLPLVAQDAPEGAEFPAADALLVALALSALGLLPLTVWALCHADLSLPQRVVLFSASGLWLGQVAHPAAHELIHRGPRPLYRLGVLLYAAMLFGHHASAHRLVHHLYVGTPQDPNSARANEGFWRFALRAWRGGFLQGLRAETRLRQRLPSLAWRRHPYLSYGAISFMALLLAYALGQGLGVLLWMGLAVHAQVQQLLADYVQHYGLTRARQEGGKYEPIGPRHAWNAPHWFTSTLMLNAPRHSDHHSHPSRPYRALRIAPEAPLLPWPLPLACCLALCPPVWRRLMRPHLQKWHDSAPVKISRQTSETGAK